MEFPLIAGFIVGLFNTLHCVGMCGGIMGALTFSLPADVRERRPRLLTYLAAYNGGRILSYAAAGALLGGLGASLLGIFGDRGHALLQGLAALLMTGIGLYIAGGVPKFALVERLGIPLWRRLEPLGRRMLPVRSPIQALLYGTIWGWLPCGTVYSMLLWTVAAQGPVEGMLAMAAFGAGTLPAVMGAGMLTAWLGRISRRPAVRRVAGLSLIALAIGSVALTEPLHRLGPSLSVH
ncbi:sulfite exporter TauE/SafE family protein [Thiohalomonas denitrificans]|nr:sulfite exporter TauE/SafE family protein [Thiohalomonas denitrificans]